MSGKNRAPTAGQAIRGANPDFAGGHSFSYRREGNRGLIRAALDSAPFGPPLG